ncbi:hypothetical protein D3C83_290130 [compost metagenome]
MLGVVREACRERFDHLRGVEPGIEVERAGDPGHQSLVERLVWRTPGVHGVGRLAHGGLQDRLRG